MISQTLLFPTATPNNNHGAKNPVSVLVMSQWSESRSVASDSLWPHGLHSPWNSPGQNTGVGSLSLRQGIFPTQGWYPGLPHCRHILYQLSYKGYLSALQFLYPGDLPDPGIKPTSLALQADSLPLEPLRLPKCPRIRVIFLITSYQMVFSVLSDFFLHRTYYNLTYCICLLVCVCVFLTLEYKHHERNNFTFVCSYIPSA